MTNTPAGQKKAAAKKAAASKKATPSARTARARQPDPVAAPEDLAESDGLAAEPEDLTAPPPPPRVRAMPSETRLYRLIAVGATVVALLLAGALIYAILRIGDDNHANALRSSALRVSVTYGAWVSSYDYTNLTAPTSTWTMIEAHSTPTFKASFDKTKASLTSLVQNYNASATGKVVSAGISSLTNSRAVVLLFIDQTVKNKLQKNGPTTEPLRAQLILVRGHGGWLIDDLRVPS